MSQDGCGKCRPNRVSIQGNAKIKKKGLKVTSKHKKKNTVDRAKNLMKLRYLSFFFPFPFTVRNVLLTHSRCRVLLLHLTALSDTHKHTHTHTQTHTTHTHTHTCARARFKAPLDEGLERRRPDKVQLSQDTDIHPVSGIRTRHSADSSLRET